jgi:hypothetical protein
MRPGQQNKRMRGRNRKGPNPLTRSFESNGGDVRIRGTALHIAEKYVQLSRDAASSGDRVAAENYLQHAEHYYRILAAAQAQMPQPQPVMRSDDDSDVDEDGDSFETPMNGGFQQTQPQNQQPDQYGGEQPGFNPGDPQPYLNGNGQEEPVEGQPMESRNNDGRERGGFRGGRRRRPFRDRQGGGERGGEGATGEGAPSQGQGAQEPAAAPAPAPVVEE